MVVFLLHHEKEMKLLFDQKYIYINMKEETKKVPQKQHSFSESHFSILN